METNEKLKPSNDHQTSQQSAATGQQSAATGQPQDPGNLGPSLLDQALDPQNALISADNIVGPAELQQRWTQVSDAVDQADLCRLTPVESSKLRKEATPQEIAIYAALAQMAKDNPAALIALGLDPRRMPSLFTMDNALLQGKNAAAQGVQITRKGVVVLAADQTSISDALAEAEIQINRDPTTTEADSRKVRAWMSNLDLVRGSSLNVEQAHADRIRRQEALHQQQLARTAARAALTTGKDNLADAPLPTTTTGTAKKPAKPRRSRKATAGAAPPKTGKARGQAQGKKKTPKVPTPAPSSGGQVGGSPGGSTGAKKETIH